MHREILTISLAVLIGKVLAAQYPAPYGDSNSLNNQWPLPGFMTELK